MHSFYFGTAREPLFGVYHPAESTGQGETRGIVLCQPLGHEYIRAHRAFRNLAVTLSAQGFHVLRFDYYGTGDSGGDGDAGSPGRAAADLDEAINELQDMAGISRVSLIGLRVGATLAAGAAFSRRDVEQLVLWDPVLKGREYVVELLHLQEAWRRGRPKVRYAPGQGPVPELIGFPLTATARTEYESMELRVIRANGVRRLDVVLSSAEAQRDVEQYLGAVEVPAEIHLVPSAGDWQRPDFVHAALLPHEILQAISALL